MCVAVTTTSLISHEGLYSVIISCYGNKVFHFSGSRGFVGVNYFTAISLFNSSITQTSQSCLSLLTFACLHVCTNNHYVCLLQSHVDRYKTLTTLLDGRHACENPIV